MNGNRLAELRKRSGKTQKEVAEGIGVAKSTLSNYEKGKQAMNVVILKRLCEYYDVTADYILGLTDIPYALGEADTRLPAWLSRYFELDREDQLRVEERVVTLRELYEAR